MKAKRKRNIRLGLIITISIVLVLFGSFYIYTLDYYRAEDSAFQALSDVEETGNLTVFHAEDEFSNGTGLIFYPGGKVEAIAYAPLLRAISEKGITCVLVEMPFNLAVFNINAADQVYDKFPEINNWYLGGHSLGGAMASSYVKKNSGKLSGLILLGAYPINDSDIPTLAIYGSEDKGLDMTKLAGVKEEVKINGGNHAYFGNYGEQKGDGTASISRENQQEITVRSIMDFME